MVALVTGANGFIGSHLVETLIKEGYSVRALVRRTSNLRWLEGLKVELVYGDVTEPESLPKAVTGVSYIFHTAGVVAARNRAGYYRVNQEGTKNLLEVVLRRNPGLKRFIYLSSQAAAGPNRSQGPMVEDALVRPVSWYGESKLRAERMVEAVSDRLSTVILRPSSVYGPRDRMTLSYFRILKTGFRLRLGTIQHRFSLIWIGDLIELILLAARRQVQSGRVYFGADGLTYTWDEVAWEAEKTLGRSTIPLYLPHWTLMAYGAISERLQSRPPLTRDKAREMVQRDWVCAIERARLELGFEPQTSLAEGLPQTITWYQKAGWL